MRRRDAAMLLLLAAMWGSSFMFIKVGVRDLAPSTLVLFRVGLASLLLLPLALPRGGTAAMRAHWKALLIQGGLNLALPFWLLSFAETRIDSGLSAVIQAASPIFLAVLAVRIDPSQRVRGARLAGLGVGLAGVALLVGSQNGGDLVGAVAVVGTAVCYAAASLLAGTALRPIPPLQSATGALLGATLLIAPVGLLQLPAETPGWKSAGSVTALAVIGSALAYLLYYSIIKSAGASRAILVTYLIPAFALVYGAAILDEAVTRTAIAGLVLILAGTAAATGVRLPHRSR
jgi:drug/metabolite transporter (DMT)-like permease